MKLILPYFILILVMLQLIIKKSNKKEKEDNASFWQRESDANSTRKKDISQLNYVEVPDLPYIESDDSTLTSLQEQIRSLNGKKILKLSDYSNTDLKLKFGVANLPQLSEYDNNFIQLTRCVAKTGALLLKSGYETEAIAFLTYGISINTDISTNYYDLAQYYVEHGEKQKVLPLIKQAEQLTTIMKTAIVDKLNAIYHES